ncbi:MAG: DNA/RNA nuclease SfsA [Lachnospiraceae bacterium]|jgi:sugar fermentation stimulation protein A|nr:DNA/RNA nuclease SfsA [Lachnospiraceae bacterium]
MRYNNIVEARFINRPNRFIANVSIDGKEETVHVKNTGRCKELLVPNADVILTKIDKPERKTKYDLISVYKDTEKDLSSYKADREKDFNFINNNINNLNTNASFKENQFTRRLINMDSQAPNQVFEEYLQSGKFIKDIVYIKREKKHGDSRFDFYVETKEKKIFIEVKGVTLEKDGAVFFPDAPTERGVKHLRGLAKCVTEGYEALVVFIVQMKGVKYFSPNYDTHPEFGNTLKEVVANGVKAFAFDCQVSKDELVVDREVQVIL